MVAREGYTVHFGVLPENVEDVIPGVMGLATELGPGKWTDWLNESVSSHGNNPVHIQVRTTNPAQVVTTILNSYMPYLVPDEDDYDTSHLGQTLVTTTLTENTDYRNTRSCVHVIMGADAIPRQFRDGA